MLELNKIYNIDRMEGLAHFPDKYFDLAIDDPPYGIHQSGGKNKTRNKLAVCRDYRDFHGEDREPPNKEYFDELFRVSKNQIIFGANHFISRIPFDSSCWIVWDKDNGGSNFADCELAWTSFPSAVRKIRYRWNGMIQENMKEKEVRIHPTQKPIALYSWILSTFAESGDRIVVPHSGSASCEVACHKLGFDFIGFEIDEHYHSLGSNRLEEERSQISIFDCGIVR